MEDDCLFCKIAKGDIPSTKVYEDDKVFAFLDLAPMKPGHTLVIHKNHSVTLFDSKDDWIADIGKRLPRIASAVKEATGADGISVFQSNGKAAGQVITHVHFHIVPRFNDDGLKHWPQGKYKEGEIEEMGKRISKLFD